MDFARRLQINSLYEAGNIFEESIPSIECEICEEELTLTTSVRDEEAVSHHFSGSSSGTHDESRGQIGSTGWIHLL